MKHSAETNMAMASCHENETSAKDINMAAMHPTDRLNAIEVPLANSIKKSATAAINHQNQEEEKISIEYLFFLVNSYLCKDS